MSRRRIVLAATCLLLALSAGLAVTLRSQPQETGRASGPDITQAVSDELIAGYREWTRVNPEPNLVDGRTAQMCAPATSLLPSNPHDKYITVYVNEIGRHAMLEEKSPHFPQGSIIVKEKLTTARSTTPELLTVMVKREHSFNADGGNWEYVVLDGEGRAVQKRGKLENCESCHLLNKGNDYVSRSYLPADVLTRLR
jgi:cytochrome P460